MTFLPLKKMEKRREKHLKDMDFELSYIQCSICEELDNLPLELAEHFSKILFGKHNGVKNFEG